MTRTLLISFTPVGQGEKCNVRFDRLHSSLLCSLLVLPALAPAVTALLPVSTFALAAAVGREGVAAAEGESSGCEAVGKIDLRANCVGEVGNDEDVLDVGVAGNQLVQFSV